MPRSFIVLGVELPWIYPLAVELGKFGHTVGISVGASYSLARRKVPEPFPDSGGALLSEAWTYPPGFNRTFASLFRRRIRERLDAVVRRVRDDSGETPFVVTPDPRFLGYIEHVEPSRLIYLNYDDYSQGRAAARTRGIAEEDALVARAGTVLCSSRYQTERFRMRFASRSRDVFHLPHGVHESFINPDPLRPPDANTVCSVGYLSSRYDWELIHEVVRQLSGVTFLFVGEITGGGHAEQREDWLSLLRATLARNNVHHVSGLKHCDTARYYWRSAVNWMPYKADLAFVKASCPLKLTDGLASGRTVVSADVPECRLYPEWVRIHHSPLEAVEIMGAALCEAGRPDAVARVKGQVAFARANSWVARAQKLLVLLNRGELGQDVAISASNS